MSAMPPTWATGFLGYGSFVLLVSVAFAAEATFGASADAAVAAIEPPLIFRNVRRATFKSDMVSSSLESCSGSR
ncbi:protein of unknown function (plasmid) [Paraburkholderia dioscoreae]|uniref:Uncharacterized protein n=1 Tax=Paraburkholderia dioscoreae TaxID=2604047 RepID=A0A5Q4Z2Q5_9BURK|nr:protein of unknown function [Paraburkholderia dioscoreae]